MKNNFSSTSRLNVPEEPGPVKPNSVDALGDSPLAAATRRNSPPGAADHQVNQAPPERSPGRCPCCGEASWWRDTYGNVHCAVCRPWPTKSLVASVWSVFVGPDDRLHWNRLDNSQLDLHDDSQPSDIDFTDNFQLVDFDNGWVRFLEFCNDLTKHRGRRG